MKLPFFGGGAKNATIASTKTVDDEETSQRRKVNIVDIGRCGKTRKFRLFF